MFTSEQENAIHTIRQGKNVLLTGPAGCGKSYVIEHFYQIYVQRCGEDAKRFIAKTSLTGISASIIGGVTLHSFLGIGLGNDPVDQLVRKIENIRMIKNRYLNLRVLIIDEISMLSAELFDKINLLFQYIRRKPQIPFGGVQVILSGDFCQLPVIGKNIKFCFQSEQWLQLIPSTFYFQHVHRQTNPIFINILLKIRLGKIDEQVVSVLTERIGKDVSVDEIRPTKLYSTRQLVNDNNNEELQKLNSTLNPIRTFHARYQYQHLTFNGTPAKLTTPLTENQTNLLKDIINKSTIAEEQLHLCKGCQVMVLMNKFVNDQALYVNGSRGVVIQFTPEGYPVVKLLNGQLHIFEYHQWTMTHNDHLIVKSQIPLKLAWSITIHKAQGLSLDCVETDIGDSLFENGQAYVALSRVRTLEGLSLISFNPARIKVHPDVIKYYEWLDEQSQSPAQHSEIYTIPIPSSTSAHVVATTTTLQDNVYTIPLKKEQSQSDPLGSSVDEITNVYTIALAKPKKRNMKTVLQHKDENTYTIPVKEQKQITVVTNEQNEKVIPLSDKQLKQFSAAQRSIEEEEMVQTNKPLRKKKQKPIMILKSEL